MLLFFYGILNFIYIVNFTTNTHFIHKRTKQNEEISIKIFHCFSKQIAKKIVIQIPQLLLRTNTNYYSSTYPNKTAQQLQQQFHKFYRTIHYAKLLHTFPLQKIYTTLRNSAQHTAKFCTTHCKNSTQLSPAKSYTTHAHTCCSSLCLRALTLHTLHKVR